jgi:hypothetical protein
MVTVTDFHARLAEDGRTYFALEVQGGIEMAQSQTTGMYYATARKAQISSTFTEEICKTLIGKELPGSVIKETCAPYEYTIKETGEVLSLKHRYIYIPEEVASQSEYQHLFEEKPKKKREMAVAEP